MLAFDIETYADWGSLSPELQEYLEGRDRARGIAPDARRASPNTASLLPGVAQVVAIGLWEGPQQGVSLSLEPGQAALHEEAQIADEEVWTRHTFQTEAGLLSAFWERASAATSAGRRLVSFNGRGFDGPVLTLRSAVLGVAPTVALAGARPSWDPHTDLVDLLSFSGARRDRYSFAYWCEVFGVPSPKQELCGAEVGAAYERGEREAIARYALADARATGKLYERLRTTLVPLAEGQ